MTCRSGFQTQTWLRWGLQPEIKENLSDLGPLDVAKSGHVEHHPVHVVGVAPHLGGGN